MENLIRAIVGNNFKVTNETSKSVEFQHHLTEEILYLLPNKEITVVLHPEKVEGIEGLEEKSSGQVHNTSFTKFPKRKNTGKDLILYGYGFKFQSVEELFKFVANYT